MARRLVGVGTAGLALTVLVVGCGTSNSTGSGGNTTPSSSGKSTPVTLNRQYAGQTVDVVYPYNPPPKQLLQQFTAKTGIKVKWTVLGWDEGYTKISSSQAAHTFLGDLTDVDWSRAGQYYRAGWYTPLNQYFNVTTLQKDIPQISAFLVNGQLVGMPIDGSLMMTTVNAKDFKAAGITTMPTTITQYTADLKTLQKTGVSPHPLGIPLAAAEGLSTYWYETTGAFGGSVLGNGYKPAFTSPSSPGYKALAWIVNAYKSGLVPQSDINMTDYQVQSEQMAHNKVATIFSDYSGNVGTLYNVPSESTVVGDINYIPTPGVNGIGPNLGNPDGMGIPKTAKHPGAAAEFMDWFVSTQMQADFAGANGSSLSIQSFPLPDRISAMQKLTKDNSTTEATTMIGLFKAHSRPVFPNGGPPPWYPQFSNAVYTNIHSAALGQESVAQAIQSIANTVNSLNQG